MGGLGRPDHTCRRSQRRLLVLGVGVDVLRLRVDVRRVIGEAAAYAVGATGWRPRFRKLRPFLVLGSARSGTELLGELLDSHPQVRCEGELFHERRPLAPRYLYGKTVVARAQGFRAWGAKLLFHQLHWFESSFGSSRSFLRGLHRDGFTLVVLERRNPLLQALSFVHAERHQYHFRDEPGRPFGRFSSTPPKSSRSSTRSRQPVGEDGRLSRTSLMSSSGTRTTSNSPTISSERPTASSGCSAYRATRYTAPWCV